MNPAIHYTDAEIAARGTEVCRHLILCADCRRRADMPSAEDLRAALFFEKDDEVLSRKLKHVLSKLPGLRFDLRFSFAALGLLVTIGILSSVLVTRSNRTEPLAMLNPTVIPAVETFVEPPFSPPELPTSKSVGEGIGNRNPGKSTFVPPKRSTKQEISFAQTRGGSNPCPRAAEESGETKVELDKVTISWPKLRGAVGYHVFVSDDNEVLIDEFESDSATSYTIREQLNPEKLYIWKVIYLMEDGSKVTGKANKFGLGPNAKTRTARAARDSRVRCWE